MARSGGCSSVQAAAVGGEVDGGAGFAGVLQGAGHQVAFDAAADGAAGALAMLKQPLGEVLHQGAVATAVAAGIVLDPEDLLLGRRLLVPAEAADDDFAVQIVTFDLSVLAHDVDGAVDVTGLGRQGEGGRDPIVEAEGHAHVVAYVVVAVVDAAAVGAGFQRLAQGGFRRFQADHIRWPLPQNGLIDLPGIEPAVQAALGSAGRGMLRGEIAQ